MNKHTCNSVTLKFNQLFWDLERLWLGLVGKRFSVVPIFKASEELRVSNRPKGRVSMRLWRNSPCNSSVTRLGKNKASMLFLPFSSNASPTGVSGLILPEESEAIGTKELNRHFLNREKTRSSGFSRLKDRLLSALSVTLKQKTEVIKRHAADFRATERAGCFWRGMPACPQGALAWRLLRASFQDAAFGPTAWEPSRPVSDGDSPAVLRAGRPLRRQAWAAELLFNPQK